MKTGMNFSIFMAIMLLTGMAGITGRAQTNCAGFSRDTNGKCFFVEQIPWIAYGEDWDSLVRIGNIKLNSSQAGPIQVQLVVVPPAGNPDVDVYYQDNRATDGNGNPVTQLGYNEFPAEKYSLLPDESVEVHLLYPPKNCPACEPDPATLAVGSLWVEYYADDPAWLRGLAGAQVQFFAKGDNGNYQFQAVEPQVEPAAGWKFPLRETYKKSENWQTTHNSSVAVANPYFGSSSIIIIALTDQNGRQVASRQYLLGPGATMGLVLWQEFGEAMFPGGRDFTGWATVKVSSPANGKITIVAFEMAGGSMGNLYAQPIQ